MLRVVELKRQGFRNFVWRYEGVMVRAGTKSEARSQFKRIMALDRLPAGANMELRVGVTE